MHAAGQLGRADVCKNLTIIEISGLPLDFNNGIGEHIHVAGLARADELVNELCELQRAALLLLGQELDAGKVLPF